MASTNPFCPGCSSPVLPGRIYCRPSCRVKHEHKQRQARPSLFASELTLDTELDEPKTNMPDKVS